MDGKIIVGTEIDQSGIEKGLEETENIITKEDLKVIIEEYVEDEDIRGKFDELNDLINEYKASSKLPIQVEGITDEVMNDTKARIEELRSELEEFFGKKIRIPALDDTPDKLEDIKNKIDRVGLSIKKVGSKLVKWGLSLFGIRTIFSMLSRSANQLAQQNDEINAKLQTIRNSLTNLLAPIIEVVINLVYKLLSYLNVITKKYLNVDLFKKSAKSAQKLTAGFDEMNILSDNSASKEKTPEPIDTSGFEKSIEDIKKNFDELLNINRDDMATMLLEQDKTWGLMKLGWFDTIQGMGKIVGGFVDTFSGIFDIIVGLATGDEEKIKEGVRTLVIGITEIVQGILQVVVGVLEMIVGAIWGALSTIALWIYEHVILPIWEFIKAGADTIWSFLKLKFSIIKGLFATLYGIITAPIKQAFDTGKKVFEKLKTAVTNVVDGIKKLFKGDLKGALDEFKTAFSNVFGALWEIAKAPINLIIRGINALISGLNKVSFDVPDWVPAIGGKTFGFNIPEIPLLKKGGIINMPGSGIAIGGESGKEGVIPLTDSQQMEILGEAIGKYITINASITNTMNGRVISRELQKISQENSFAGNR